MWLVDGAAGSNFGQESVQNKVGQNQKKSKISKFDTWSFIGAQMHNGAKTISLKRTQELHSSID